MSWGIFGPSAAEVDSLRHSVNAIAHVLTAAGITTIDELRALRDQNAADDKRAQDEELKSALKKAQETSE